MQHEMGKKQATAERNALQQSMLQAERNAKKYKDKLQIAIARSETEKDIWRNKEMKLLCRDIMTKMIYFSLKRSHHCFIT